MGAVLLLASPLADLRNQTPAPRPLPSSPPVASRPDLPATATRDTTGMEFVRIQPGEFMMGCSTGDSQCRDDENPAHPIRITKALEIGKYEVTQAQWESVLGTNPSYFKGADRPVERVSWNVSVRQTPSCHRR